ncbi:YveK family protein [Mesobacillus sp. S13]|uniref:YveK family protein n=1 Tax=Mesobacillus sp. S13 TaxID=2880221 RepID=UPI001CF3A5C2|nr:Wzz/FepE/Etk N-terminal domain-containing protein [Mesobacillus sp. S13]
MDEKTDLKKFFSIINRRKWTVIITLFCVLIMTVIGSFFLIKPTYEATQNIVVGKFKKEEGYYGETQEVYMLLASTKDFIKSPTVLNAVQKELKFKDKKLDEKIVVQNNKDSQIISVIVRDHDPERTQLISETIVRTTVQKMKSLFEISDLKVLTAIDGSSEVERVGSNALNIAIGGLIGLFMGIGVAMIREYLDDSIKSMDEIEAFLGLPVLGSINLKNDMKRKKHRSVDNRVVVLKQEKGGEFSV